MMIGRALLAVVIVGTTIYHADAQIPGMPGGGGFGGQPAAPPPQCQALLAIRDDLQKRGQAIEAANQKKASVKVACQLFRNYIAAEAKFIKALETNGASCGAPPQVVQQVRGGHAKAQQLGKQVCDAAARGVTAGPTLSDALGTSPVLPDPSKKKGAGTFETLTGNPFARP
jgi:hypothetical protein